MKINSSYQISSPLCFRKTSELTGDPGFAICDGAPIRLSLEDGPATRYLWNEGQTSSEIIVESSGYHFLKYEIKAACGFISKPVCVEENPVDNPRVVVAPDEFVCVGEQVTLRAKPVANVRWSNGTIGKEITVESAGDYYYDYEGACESFRSDTVNIKFLQVIAPVVTRLDSLMGPGNALIEVKGEGIRWYSDEGLTQVIESGSLIELEGLERDSCVYVTSAVQTELATLGGGESEHVGDNKYHGAGLNVGTEFFAHKNMIFNSVEVFTDSVGVRRIQLMQDKVPIESGDFYLESGANTIELNWKVNASDDPYILTTDESVNFDEFGTNSPWLYRSNLKVEYPYRIGDVLELIKSEKGSTTYYYFYNWEITELSDVCESEALKVCAKVLTSTRQVDKGNEFLDSSIPARFLGYLFRDGVMIYLVK